MKGIKYIVLGIVLSFVVAGSGYKSLGNLDTNAYKLQVKENTWSALGFYWNGKWKLSR